MTTIKTPNGRSWQIIDTKSLGDISLHLVHGDVPPEAVPYAEWGLVATKGGRTRFEPTDGEAAAREKFSHTGN